MILSIWWKFANHNVFRLKAFMHHLVHLQRGKVGKFDGDCENWDHSKPQKKYKMIIESPITSDFLRLKFLLPFAVF